MRTTIEEMARLKIYSDDWFNAAFEGCTATDSVIRASKRICRAYGIRGQADPAYIANVINDETNK